MTEQLYINTNVLGDETYIGTWAEWHQLMADNPTDDGVYSLPCGGDCAGWWNPELLTRHGQRDFSRRQETRWWGKGWRMNG